MIDNGDGRVWSQVAAGFVGWIDFIRRQVRVPNAISGSVPEEKKSSPHRMFNMSRITDRTCKEAKAAQSSARSRASISCYLHAALCATVISQPTSSSGVRKPGFTPPISPYLSVFASFISSRTVEKVYAPSAAWALHR